MIEVNFSDSARAHLSLLALALLLICPHEGWSQVVSTVTLHTTNPPAFAKQSEYYKYGFLQWIDEMKEANAAGDTAAADAAKRKAMAWNGAKLIAELAEAKSSLVGGEVKMLPTPGTINPDYSQPDVSWLKVVGEPDSVANLQNQDNPAHVRLYQHYIAGMRIWYDRATAAKSANNAAELQIALTNAQAFEAAYLSVKNAETRARTAGSIIEITPVPGLPPFPSVPLRQQIATAGTMAAPPAPMSTPASATPLSLAKVVVLSDAGFSKTILDGTWVVEFGATWCGPCKAMKPVLDSVSSELGGRVKFGVLDADKNPAYLRRYNIKAFPTFVLIKNGTAVATKVGGMSRQKLVAFATQ